MGDDSTFNKNQEFVVEAVDVEKNERTNKWGYIIRYVAKNFKPQNRLSYDQITELINAGKVNLLNSGQLILKIKGYHPDFAKGGTITFSDLDELVSQINEAGGGQFSLGGAYGYQELWAKDKDGNSHRLESGSKKDIYQALI